MYISDRSRPELSILTNKDLSKVIFRNGDVKDINNISGNLRSIFYNNIEYFNNNKYYICKSFDNAMRRSIKHIQRLALDEVREKKNIQISGTYIFNDATYMVNITYNENFTNSTGLMFGEYHELICAVDSENDFRWNSNDVKKGREELNLNLLVLYPLYIYIFMKYAEVETKHIKKNTKEKINGVKAFNKSNLDITYLDSKWFTNIIMSEGFGVSGHFRLQPYKNNMNVWNKKLIWINDYKKNGYTSKEKVTSYK